MGRAVLVTGVAGDLGRRFGRRLAESADVDKVVGVDVVPPRRDLGAMQFVRADIRTPVIAKVIAREQVDTVVHLSVTAQAAPAAGGRSSAKELNVIGTMQLLAACQQAEALRHLVVGSSTAVYGASNRDPAMFTEETPAKRLSPGGFARDVTEVEGYVRGFARRRPDVRVTTLRMADVVGPRFASPLTAYFGMPVIPTVLGFDPRLQLLHEEDAYGCLERAVTADVPGTYNVAGEKVLMLSQAIRRLGRPALPLPAFALSGIGPAMRQARGADFSPGQIAFLTYGRGVDTTRLRQQLGFVPAYDTPQAFAAMAAGLRPGLLDADRVQAAEAALSGVLTAPATGSDRG